MCAIHLFVSAAYLYFAFMQASNLRIHSVILLCTKVPTASPTVPPTSHPTAPPTMPVSNRLCRPLDVHAMI